MQRTKQQEATTWPGGGAEGKSRCLSEDESASPCKDERYKKEEGERDGKRRRREMGTDLEARLGGAGDGVALWR